jgi:hypothetical protein
MSFVAGITPVAAALLACAVAYVSVRRAHRKAMEARREAGAAAE